MRCGRPLLALWCVVAGAGAAHAAPAEARRVEWVCEAVYLPARTAWTRRVEVVHDDQRLRAVRIDGVAVHRFSVVGNVILTSLDSERIQIDTAAPSWRSDLRGLSSAQGRCERVGTDTASARPVP